MDVGPLSKCILALYTLTVSFIYDLCYHSCKGSSCYPHVPDVLMVVF